MGLAPSTAVTLLRRAKASFILVGPGGEEFAETISTHGVSLPRLTWYDHTHRTELFDMKSFIDDGLYQTTISAQDLAPETALIAHTSGSTNIPKLIPIRNVCITQVKGPREGGVRDVLFLGSPQQGAHTYVPITNLAEGNRCYIYNQTAPFDIPTIIKAIKAATMGGTNKVNTFLTYPAMHLGFKMSDFAEEAIALLRSFDGIVSGGSAPTLEVQQWLGHADIKVCNYIGSTEAGTIIDSGRPKTSDWDWVVEHTTTSTWITFEPYDDTTGASELVILPGFPTLNVCNRPDGSYTTDDLYLPHPETKGKWRHWMRKGNVMVHSTGMKTDPIYSGISLQPFIYFD